MLRNADDDHNVLYKGELIVCVPVFHEKEESQDGFPVSHNDDDK